jgi:hypothetical protein
MLDEMTAIEANGTWELVDAPTSQRPIGLKWVFKTKKDASGVIIKHKARLVAKGYVQQPGIDFDEVFAPVARLETVRMLLAYAANEGCPSHGREIGLPQWGSSRGGVCDSATGVHRRWSRAQGVAAEQGTVWPAAGVVCLVR